MIFKIIFAIILLIALITLMYNIIIGVRTDNDKLIVLCGLGTGLIGIMFGVVLSIILFNI